MRIIYLHQYFNTPAMSGGTRSYEMARRLVNSGHTVNMVTSARGTESQPQHQGWKTTEEAGIYVHWLSIPYSNHMSYSQRIKAFFRFAWESAFKAASLQGDVVFATSTPLTIALPAVYAAKKLKVPMVFEVRDLWPELPIAIGALKNPVAIKFARLLESFAYNNADRIIALSPGMRDGILKTGYPAARVHVIPNSADLDLFTVSQNSGLEFRQKHTWLQDRPLIVYAGTLGEINGVEYLVKIAAKVKVKDPECRFLIIGNGKEEEKIRVLAQEMGILNDNFFMMNSVSKQEIPTILSAATLATSLFINLKEMWANSANKFFDALASGTPIAINYGGWQADILEKTGAGIVLDPIDVSQSADMIIEKIRNTDWLVSAGKASRKLAEDTFSRDNLARELESVLKLAVIKK